MNFWGAAVSLRLLLLLAVCVCVSVRALEVTCGSDTSLPCEAGRYSPKFRSLTWYKVPPLTSSPQSANRTGILRKQGNTTTLYPNPRTAGLGPEGQLMLSRVMPNDSGTYECLLRANLGGQNLESSIYLSVTACMEYGDVETRPALESPLLEVLEVHTGWAVLAFSTLSLLKVLICLVALKVFAQVIRSKRHYQLGSQKSQRSQGSQR